MCDWARFRSRALENSLTAYKASVRRDDAETVTYIFFAILVPGNMDGAKRASANLLLDHILVDTMLSHPIVLAGDIFGSSVEGFLRLISAGGF